jgi:hypothetical protein
MIVITQITQLLVEELSYYIVTRTWFVGRSVRWLAGWLVGSRTGLTVPSY